MKILKLLLFPFSILYGIIIGIRNWLYDVGFFKSYSYEIPIIAVGNLSTGGTGKTPQVEYLIRLLSIDYHVAVLSRGYKRHSNGFVLADENATAMSLGDEPFQYHQKFSNVHVAVDADRVNGVRQLLNLPNKPEIILLDDAFQHRRLKAGIYILLTAYNDLYCDDYILPTGNLRESRGGAKRANTVIITKCPPDISENEQNQIINKLKLQENQSLYFSFIDYENIAISHNKNLNIDKIRETEKLIITGIAKPKSFIDFVKNNNDEVLIYPDHHHFSAKNLVEIDKKSQNKIILTTEKDYVRLQNTFLRDKLFYLGIKTGFITNKNIFDKQIIDFINN